MRQLFVPISVSLLAAAFIFLVWTGATNVLQDTGRWFSQLDRIINAGLFASMATIALAAASFLMGSVGQARRELDVVATTLADLRAAADAQTIARAERRLAETGTATREDIGGADLDDGTRAYLIALGTKRATERTLKDITRSKDALVLSFFCFLFGLIEAITLDLWIRTPIKNLEETESWFETIAVSLRTYPGVFFDIVLSSGFLIAGLYFLVRGARSLLSKSA